MNTAMVALLTKYRPVAREYHKNALIISGEMLAQLTTITDLVAKGTMTREMGLRKLREQNSSCLGRVSNMSAELYRFANALLVMMNNVNIHNATDLVEGTKELLHIAQEVSLEGTMAIRTIQSQWENYEAVMALWVKDIQKGLK